MAMVLHWLGALLGGLGLAVHLVGVQTTAEEGPPLATQGPYTNQAEHWAGRYHVLRTGTQVRVTLTTHRSPVQHWARQAPQALLRLPEGYRPRQRMTWTVEAPRVTGKGRPESVELPAVTVTLVAQPDGTVHYLDKPALDRVGYVAYTTTVTWDTAEVALFSAGALATAGWMGQYRLERRGSVVTATLITAALGEAADNAVLFTVPTGFRPPHAVWEPDFPPSGDLHVQPDGTVQYTARHPETGNSVERYTPPRVGTGDGAPPAVTQLRWQTGDPAPETGGYALSRGEADVCHRLAAVQHALLTALQTIARPRNSCVQVTWADLASLQTLNLYLTVPPERPFLPHDLAGLTHLQDLDLVPESASLSLTKGIEFPPEMLMYTPELRDLKVSNAHKTVPTDFLAYTPKLEKIILQLSYMELPANFLAYAPQLREVTITPNSFFRRGGSDHIPELPADFLAHAPQLQKVSIESILLSELPAGFLAHAPQLQRLELYLYTAALAALPSDFLTYVPQLQDLTLYAAALAALPSDFLSHTPQLQRLDLGAAALAALPAGFLTHIPQLQELDLRAAALAALPTGFLSDTPQLQELDLQAAALAALPTGFLSDTPQLQDLTLYAAALAALPAGFLSHTPQLQRLDLRATALAALPAGFLTHTPQLQDLMLYAAALAALPAGFLSHTPQLQELDLRAAALAALPSDFPAHAPQLQELRLYAAALAMLPSDFLIHVPQLQKLTLYTDALAALPSDFLVHVPQLQKLDLQADALAALPSDFLVHIPQLQRLDLQANALAALPAGFLTHNPQLQRLYLYSAALAVLPSDFLAYAPQLQRLELHAAVLAALPSDFLAYTPSLMGLNLKVPALTALSPAFLAHAPRMTALLWRIDGLTVLPPDFPDRVSALLMGTIWRGERGNSVSMCQVWSAKSEDKVGADLFRHFLDTCQHPPLS